MLAEAADEHGVGPPGRTPGGSKPSAIGSSPPSGHLGQHLDDDATVLGAAIPGVVRRGRLGLAVADHVHLVERHLVLLVKIALDRFGALEAELLIDDVRARVVGVPFDLEVDPLRVGLDLRCKAVSPQYRGTT